MPRMVSSSSTISMTKVFFLCKCCFLFIKKMLHLITANIFHHILYVFYKVVFIHILGEMEQFTLFHLLNMHKVQHTKNIYTYTT